MSSGSPGRNDPCPCGSGRKYKACCLAAGREGRRAGAASLSTVEGTDGADDVWQAEVVPHPAAIENDPDGRITVALVVSSRGPLWAEVHRSPPGEPEVVAGLLSDAVLAAAKKTGRLPGRVEARHADVVRALADRLRDRSVEVVARQRLDRLDGLAGAMVAGDAVGADMAYPRPCVSIPETWRAWSLPDESVAALFAAGAEFHRSEAWEMLDDEAPLEMETADGLVWAFSVLGAAGIETGLAMYSDPSDLERTLSASAPLPVEEFVGRCLAFTFDPANVIPPPMRREVLLAGWEVAAPDAYPMLHTINTPGGGVSEADARDLVTALRAVETGCDRLGGAYLLGEAMEWRDAGTGATVRLAKTPGRRRRAGPELAPDCAARFDEVAGVLGDFALDDDVPVLLVNTATSLLYDYALSDPGSFLAARKLEVLAAAALHASGMILDSPWGDWRPTLEELADRFGVSTAAIATRSRAMRDLLPTPGELEELLVEALLREVAATADRERDGRPPGG